MEWTYSFQENEPSLLKHHQAIGLKTKTEKYGEKQPMFSELFGEYVQATALHIYKIGS